jgi:hypothetical protein
MIRILSFLLITVTLLTSACGLLQHPEDVNHSLFKGIKYIRDVRTNPRPMVIHVVRVDLSAEGIEFLVTPGDPKKEFPLKASTTSQFLKRNGFQIAINGGAFSPWYSNTLLDYYPHVGDPIKPIGTSASRGSQYAVGTDEEPTLYISRTNQANFNNKIGNLYNAISGTRMLVKNGQKEPDLESTPDPRSAVALTKSNKELILIVVDGRQTGYSEGATYEELAEIILAYGGYNGMNLDGGGSSTMVIEDEEGNPRILNSPIDNNIPGRERAVGNHLGIFAHRGNDQKKNEKGK